MQNNSEDERDIRKISISKVVPDADQPRKNFGDVEEFADSLDCLPTIDVPLIVEKSGTGYVILDGERRHRAAVKAGMRDVWCDVRTNLTDLERSILRLRLNFQHKRWADTEEVKEVRKAYKTWLMKKFTETEDTAKKGRISEFAKVVGIKQQALSDMLAVADSHVSCESLRHGESFEVAAQLARQKTVERQKELLSTAHSMAKKANKSRVSVNMIREAASIVNTRHEDSLEERNKRAFEDIMDTYGRIAQYYPTLQEQLKHITEEKKAELVQKTILAHIAGHQEFLGQLRQRFTWKQFGEGVLET